MVGSALRRRGAHHWLLGSRLVADLTPHSHRQKTLYAWCAWDTLFMPELLGETMRVESQCPETQRNIYLTASPHGVSALDPPGMVMSLLTPEATRVRENVVAHFVSTCTSFTRAKPLRDGFQNIQERSSSLLRKLMP